MLFRTTDVLSSSTTTLAIISMGPSSMRHALYRYSHMLKAPMITDRGSGAIFDALSSSICFYNVGVILRNSAAQNNTHCQRLFDEEVSIAADIVAHHQRNVYYRLYGRRITSERWLGAIISFGLQETAWRQPL